jgi:hypothetical protein
MSGGGQRRQARRPVTADRSLRGRPHTPERNPRPEAHSGLQGSRHARRPVGPKVGRSIATVELAPIRIPVR